MDWWKNIHESPFLASAAAGDADLSTVFENIAKDVPDADWERIPADLSTNFINSFIRRGRHLEATRCSEDVPRVLLAI
jgi:hypothetical protein